MTTNESFFFRDKIPFDHFRQVIMPALLAARAAPAPHPHLVRRRLDRPGALFARDDPLKEMAAKVAGWRIEIIATDLSNEVLEKARAGIYSQFEVQRGLPIQMLVKYFTQVGEMWQIAPEIRAMVQYRPLNLLHDLSPLGTFDVVFCRNVLIYFDQDTKIAVLDRIARVIEPDGYLALGAAETVVGLDRRFQAGPRPARTLCAESRGQKCRHERRQGAACPSAPGDRHQTRVIAPGGASRPDSGIVRRPLPKRNRQQNPARHADFSTTRSIGFGECQRSARY